MSQLFITQGILIITLETSFNLAGASTTQILYRKPDGTEGAWNASVSGTDLVYNVSNTDIDVSGNWRLQAFCIIAGQQGFGKVVTQQFKLPL